MKQRKNAFTLIELLVVIAIIAVLISILLPALSLAKEEANIAYCLSNLRTLNTTTSMYINDQDDKLFLPWHMGFNIGTGFSATWASEYIYGGFQHSIENPDYPNTDTYIYPTEARPFNKFIAPGVTGRANRIDTYTCPSDKWNATGNTGGGGTGVPDINDAYPSWMVNGNSFPINWYWVYGPPFNGSNGYFTIDPPNNLAMVEQGASMLSKKIGGNSAEFPLFSETSINPFMYEARPQEGPGQSPLQTLLVGWHRKMSKYSLGFFDGHAEHKYVDTRYCRGPGYDFWPEPNTPLAP